MRRPDVVEQYEKLGLLPIPSTPDSLAALVKEQRDVFARTMKDIGMQQE
jgi:tripartite-type tricarboxylate transporter receptor subunit TctC